MLRTMIRYKRWANQLTFKAVKGLAPEEVIKKRRTKYRNIVYTLNHVFVIDKIFQAHLLGQSHDYRGRNTKDCPTLAWLEEQVVALDDWYVEYVDGLDAKAQSETVHFKFVDDDAEGKMTREEIILHLVNHGTYHRGLVSDMFYQIPAKPISNDLTLYLRVAKA